MNKRRFLALVVAGATFMGNMQVFAANFTDMNNVPWEGSKTYINSVADLKLMVGDYDAKNKLVFRAKEGVTYCETMQLVYALKQKITGTSVSNDVKTKWASVMKGYKIPAWVQPAVAYGLENGIITISDVPGFVDSKGSASVNTTRQDVAIMFGRALKDYGTVNNNASLSFKDASSINSVAVPHIDLLVRLGVISGDDVGNFNPKKTINRAEMSVFVSKSYDIMNKKPVTPPAEETGSVAGKITTSVMVGGSTIITVESGSQTYSYTGTDATPVLQGDKKVLMSSLKAGDSVNVSFKGQNIMSVLVTDTAAGSGSTSSDTKGRNVTGTFSSVTTTNIKIKESGSTKTYKFKNEEKNDVTFYVNSKENSYNSFKSAAASGEEVKLVLDTNEEVIRAYVEGSLSGKYASMSTSSLKVKMDGKTETYKYEDNDESNVDFFIDGKSTTYEKFKAKAKTSYTVKIKMDSKEEYITEADLITVEDEEDSSEEITGTYEKIGTTSISIKTSGRVKEYNFKGYDDSKVSFYYGGRLKDRAYIRSTAEKGDTVKIELDGKEALKVYVTVGSDDSGDTISGTFVKLGSTYISIKKGSSTKQYNFSDENKKNVKFYYEGKTKDYNYIDSNAERGDTTKLELDGGEVVKVWVTTYTDEGDTVDGELKSVGSSSIKVGNSSYDFADTAKQLTVKVKDGNETNITTYDKLKTAVSDDGKIVQASVVLDSDDEVTEITGYVKTAKGVLTGTLSQSSIQVKFSSGTRTKYSYTAYDVNFTVEEFSSSYKGLEKANDSVDYDEVEVELTFGKSGEITDIYAVPQ